jgi:hypothetical protein
MRRQRPDAGAEAVVTGEVTTKHTNPVPDTESVTFGFDVVDAVESNHRDPTPPFGYDTVDWIEDLGHDLPVRCPQCHEAWLMGPEALAAGECWSCRTRSAP